MAVYVISDLHGQYDLFVKGLKTIEFGDDDFLWCLGDSIDRGPAGIEILTHIKSHANMDTLIGNHELMMLNAVSPDGSDACNGRDSTLWRLANGGNVTLKHYLLLSEQERVDLINWLRSRYVIRTLNANNREFCLSHSYYNGKCENKRYNDLSYEDVSNITWSSIWRDDMLTHAEDIYSKYDYTFVIGHVPVLSVRKYKEYDEDWNRLESIHHGNVINIDGGCAIGRNDEFRNGLIIYRLDDGKEFGVEL